MSSMNVYRIANYVQNIVDNCRCVMCDGLEKHRVRYACGHSICDDCVLTAENCSLCLSPTNVSHVIDGPLSLRVQRASNLLQSFQELFKLDVYRKQRLSEQLQVEKEFFPDCIQAPSKYSNNRRSSVITIQNNKKHKHTVFPGENTSKSNIFNKMENKINYVQQWLNKNETSLKESNIDKVSRKPFTDINVNSQKVTRPQRPNTVGQETKDAKGNKLIRNKVHLNSSNNINRKDKSKLSLKRKINDGIKTSNKKIVCKKIKCDKHESGIVIDDEITVIDDSQDLDKDEKALLAVAEADKNCHYDDITPIKLCETKKILADSLDRPVQCYKKNFTMGKVPFYIKSPLCNNDFKQNDITIKSASKTNTFTINNETFIATIRVYKDNNEQCTLKQSMTKYSIGVQTENENNFIKINSANNDNLSKSVKLKAPVNVNSNNFNDKKYITASCSTENNNQNTVNLIRDIAPTSFKSKGTHQLVQEPKCLIIPDSDTDSDDILPSQKDSLLEVTAEVHRSESEIVLSQLEQGDYEHRTRHARRGHTPLSTDSSDKENYDPNRVKRRKSDKKCGSKKH